MANTSYVREQHNEKTFQDELNIRAKGYKKLFQKYGYNLIAFTQLLFEYTFVFETQEIADSGYKKFECEMDYDSTDSAIPGEDDDCTFVGWWYGLEYFKKTLNDYEHMNYFGTPHIIWFEK